MSSLPVANTLTGTTGNDILNAPGSVQTDVFGLQGNDTITLALSSDNAYGAEGDDSFNVNVGTLNGSVYGGDGNDTLAFSTASTIFNGRAVMGGGTDLASTSATQITGVVGTNAGNDTIRFQGGGLNGRISAGADADLVTVTAGTMTNVTTHGGKGKDTLTLNGGTFTTSTVAGNQGSDIINASAATLTNVAFNLGKGNDSIALASQSSLTVAGGAGNDSIGTNTTFAFGGGIIYGDKSGVTTSTTSDITGSNAANPNGADLIGHTSLGFLSGGTGGVSVYGGGGSDTVKFQSGATGQTFIVDGGDGGDLLGTTASLLTYSASTISGGAGADTIKIAGMGTQGGVILLGGAGHDSITLVSAGNNEASVNGGAGNDTINFFTAAGAAGGGHSAGLITINGGSGADVINFSVASAGEIQTLTTFTGQGITGQTTYHAGIVYEAGDLIQYNNTSISTTGANWAGAGGQILIVTSITALTVSGAANGVNYSAQSSGSISVFENGTDTYFFINGNNRTALFSFVVLGKDLVTTTSVGLVNNTSANFLFTPASDTGTSGTAAAGGVQITLL